MNRQKQIMDSLMFYFLPIGLFALMYPNILEQVHFAIAIIFNIRRVLFYFCVFSFFYYKMFMKKYIWFMMAFFAWMQACDVFAGNIIRFETFTSAFSIVVLSTYFMERRPTLYCGYMAYMMTTWIALNTLLWRPGGTYINTNGQLAFFIGTKTSITYFQLIACFFVFIYKNILPAEKKIRAWVLWWILFISLVVYYLVQPISTSLICLVSFVGILIIDASNEKLAQLGYKIGFLVTLLLNVLVVFVGAQSFFASFIEDVLHEDVTLDGRTIIWADVLHYIIQSPWVGFGHYHKLTFGWGFAKTFNTSTHNQMLSWMIMVGGIGLAYILLVCIRAYYGANSKTNCGKIVRNIFIAFGFFWIAEQWYDYIKFCAFLTVCFNLKYLLPLEEGSGKIRMKWKLY